MRIGICEDIAEQARMMEAQIRSYFQANRYLGEIRLYADGAGLLAEQDVLDLVFMDWVLPDQTGLNVAQSLLLRDPAPSIIFVSAYPEYVFDSFEVNPVWYLVKPISEAQLNKAMDAFFSYFDRDLMMELVLENEKKLLRLRDIAYIEANKKCAVVRCRTNDPEGWLTYESVRPLAELSSVIRSPRFFRTHKSYLVNMDYIERIEDGIIYIKNGERVLLSRRNRAAFERSFNGYLKRSL